MSLLGDMLSACIDHVFAPDCAFDPFSDGYCETQSSTASAESHQEMDVSWHNSFGTAADFQVAAESGDAFQSNDWSTFDSSSSFNEY